MPMVKSGSIDIMKKYIIILSLCFLIFFNWIYQLNKLDSDFLMAEYIFGDSHSIVFPKIPQDIRNIHFYLIGKNIFLEKSQKDLNYVVNMIHGYDDILSKYPERKEIALNVLRQTFCEIGDEKVTFAFNAFVTGKNNFKQDITFAITDICPKYLSVKP